MARIFGGYDTGLSKNAKRAESDVFEVADRSTDNEERAGRCERFPVFLRCCTYLMLYSAAEPRYDFRF
jgi:hypothetical protein